MAVTVVKTEAPAETEQKPDAQALVEQKVEQKPQEQPSSPQRHNDRPRNVVQTSATRPPAFFARIGRRLLHNSTPELPSFETITIAGLGLAIRTAVGAASRIETEKQGTITSVETSLFVSSNRGRRRLPKILIVITRNPDAPNLDAVEHPPKQLNQVKEETPSSVTVPAS